MRRVHAVIAVTVLVVVLAWVGWLLVGGRQVRDGLTWAKQRIEAKQYAPVRERLVRLSAWWPRHGEVEYLLGVCESKLGRPYDALAAWARVPKGSPTATTAAFAQGLMMLQSLGRLHDAELWFRTAARGHGARRCRAAGRWPSYCSGRDGSTRCAGCSERSDASGKIAIGRPRSASCGGSTR